MSTIKSFKQLVNTIDPDVNEKQYVYEFSGKRRFYEGNDPYGRNPAMIFRDDEEVVWMNTSDTVFDKGQI